MNVVKCDILKELEIVFIIVVLYGSNVLTQKMSMGFCPPVEPMSFFDVDEYMGTWYQHASVKSLLKALHSCVEYNYTADSHGGFHVESSYSSYRYPFPIKQFGYAKPEQYHGFPQKGAYKMTLFSGRANLTIDHLILQTDCDTYSVEYSCFEFMFFKRQNLRVLVRDRLANSTVILKHAYEALKPLKLEWLFRYLKPTRQTNCTT